MDTRTVIERAGGIEAVADRFSAKVPYVRRLQYGDKLPAQWYAALCDMTEWELPRSLFSFKGLQ